MIRKKFKTLNLLVFFLLIIIVFVNILNYANSQIQKKSSDDIITDMLIIQSKVKIINGEIKTNSENVGYVGTKLSDLNNNDLKNKAKKVGIKEDSLDKYYLLNSDDFNKLEITEELKNIKNDEYIVNYDEKEVIYIDGIQIDGNVKYKLSDMLDNNDSKIWSLYNQIQIK